MIDSASETGQPDSPCAVRLFPSPNHGDRRARRGGELRSPDSIILHYTGMVDAASALLWLCNPLSEVSCHYFVFEDGRIFQLVPEGRRAWHAGRSSWHGETDMNSASIGIEIVNVGHDLSVSGPFPPVGPYFPDAQMNAVISLVADIKARWAVVDTRILAHSDIAPGRKIDPGERFPWEALAHAGLGLWPRVVDVPKGAPVYRPGDKGMPVSALQSMFAAFGYGLGITGVFDAETAAVVAAFQRHWRPSKVDGVADGETLATLAALSQLT
ncbi:ampD N-acetyl-anhydromuramyl-L-alanine amidase [Rhabdaerophilaceae bacterium]